MIIKMKKNSFAATVAETNNKIYITADFYIWVL